MTRVYFATLWRIFIEDHLSCHLNKDQPECKYSLPTSWQQFFPSYTIELWRSRRWPVQATLLTQFWRMVLFSSSMRPVRSSHWICLAPSRRWTQPWELPISVGSTTEWLTFSIFSISALSPVRHYQGYLCHKRQQLSPNLRKIYSEQICSFWMSSAVRISWCSMCGSKFSWPPHCPQCSDWWEWQLVHVSMSQGSELLPGPAQQQCSGGQWSEVQIRCLELQRWQVAQ